MTDESFLSRWSRLKRKEAEPPEPTPVLDPPPPPAVTESEGAVAEAPGAVQNEDALKDLPPVESLTAESDFTPFLRADVPEDLHRQALRKLWTSDPVYANDDGLKDYAGDYTGLFKGVGVVKTAYRVGKGFLDAAEEAAERAEEEAARTAAAGSTAATDDESKVAPALAEDPKEDPNGDGDMPKKT
jgi:hypothetical protein